jgi:CARDB
MLHALLAAAILATAPSPCADLLVANPRLKVVRAANAEMDNYVVTVDVRNRGSAGQTSDVKQHLELIHSGAVIGTQPIPPLEASQSYIAAFRLQLPHENKRRPLDVVFHYVLDRKDDVSRNNCSSANDRLSVTL